MNLWIILFITLVILLFISLLKTSSIISITKKNIKFLDPILPNFSQEKQKKVQNIINWHIQHHHPLYLERSTKYHKKENYYNNSRFTIVLPLSFFFKDSNANLDEKKWNQWAQIIDIPLEIEKKCLDYLIIGKGSIDFYWGLDIEKEKIYLEDSLKGYIESYIVENGKVLNRFMYKKSEVHSKYTKFSFMYKRYDEKKQHDSTHCILKKPISLKNYSIYVVSFDTRGEILTFYYRVS